METKRELVLYYEGEPAIVYYVDEITPYEKVTTKTLKTTTAASQTTETTSEREEFEMTPEREEFEMTPEREEFEMTPEREEFEVIRKIPLYQVELDLERLKIALKKLKKEYAAVSHLLRMTPIEEMNDRHRLKVAKKELLLKGGKLAAQYDRLAKFYNEETKTQKYPYTSLKKKNRK
jgi:hypothetical protein